MRIRRVEEPSEDLAGSLVLLGPGDGAGTNRSAPLCISSLWRRGRTTNSTRGPSLLHLPLGPGIGGDRAGVPGARGGIGRQDGTASLRHRPDLSHLV